MSNPTADAPAALPESNGFDVSDSGSVAWHSLKPRFTFAFIESTQGATLHNSTFAPAWHGSAGAGIVRGAYHFFFASTSTPQAQTQNLTTFVQQNGGFQPGDLPPVLDIEEASIQKLPAATVVARFQALCDLVKAAVTASTHNPRFVPIIYTNSDTWVSILGDPDLSSHPLWIANFSSTAKQPAVPPSWGDGNYLFWQFTDTTTGIVPGGDGADLDRFHVLADGANNSEVRRVQQWLHDTSVTRGDTALDPKGVDGAFGPNTAAAVRRLQTIDVNAAGAPANPNLGPLPATGVVDVVTWAKLLWA